MMDKVSLCSLQIQCSLTRNMDVNEDSDQNSDEEEKCRRFTSLAEQLS